MTRKMVRRINNREYRLDKMFGKGAGEEKAARERAVYLRNIGFSVRVIPEYHRWRGNSWKYWYVWAVKSV